VIAEAIAYIPCSIPHVMIEQLACKMKLLKDLLWNPTTTMFIRQLVEQGGFGGKTIGPRLKVRSVV
jgi:hypothetical protein